MPWRRSVPVVRWVVRRETPELTRPRRLPPGRRVVGVARHLGLAVGLWAVGARRKGGSESRADISRRLRVAAEHLGPTYIKLGQIISSGEGLFPEELVREFKRCRDQVPPEPWDQVRAVIESELGQPLESVFAELDHTPLAAAVDRPGARGDAAHRRAGGGQGAAAVGGPPGARRPQGHGLAGAVPGGPHPHRRAGQPARAGRAVRRDDHRGARLPPRGPEHARRGPRRSPSSANGATSSPAPIPSSSPRGCWSWSGSTGSPSTTWPAWSTPGSTPRTWCAPA